jgi:hypothetical protein
MLPSLQSLSLGATKSEVVGIASLPSVKPDGHNTDWSIFGETRPPREVRVIMSDPNSSEGSHVHREVIRPNRPTD